MANRKYQQLVQYIRDNQQAHYHYALSLVKHESDAKDVLQDAIVKALRKYHQIKDLDKINAWFYLILRNTAYDYLKAKKMRQYTPLELVGDEGSYEEQYRDYELQAALKILNEKEYDVINLKYFQGLKFREIAEVINEPESTVKSRLYYSLLKLKEWFLEDKQEVNR